MQLSFYSTLHLISKHVSKLTMINTYKCFCAKSLKPNEISYLLQHRNWSKGQQYCGKFGNKMVNKVTWQWIVVHAMHQKKFRQNSFQLHKLSHIDPSLCILPFAPTQLLMSCIGILRHHSQPSLSPTNIIFSMKLLGKNNPFATPHT